MNPAKFFFSNSALLNDVSLSGVTYKRVVLVYMTRLASMMAPMVSRQFSHARAGARLMHKSCHLKWRDSVTPNDVA
jgi:hypothetical protein